MTPLLLFAAYALEVILLIKLGQLVGAPAVLIEVLLTAIVGYVVLRRTARSLSGQRLLIDLLANPRAATQNRGAVLFLSGLLLILPGLLSDLAGVTLLLRTRFHGLPSTRGERPDPNVIDVEFEVRDESTDEE
jgi:UPF0716 protein FxsA